MAWSQRSPWGAPAPRSKTLAEIMREEEDARLASTLTPKVTDLDEDEQFRLALELSMKSAEDDRKKKQLQDDEELARALAAELNSQEDAEFQEMNLPSKKQTSNDRSDHIPVNEFSAQDNDEEVARLLELAESENLDEDEMLAKFLQIEERKLAGNLSHEVLFKELTPLEQKLFNLEFGEDAFEDEEDEDIDLRKEIQMLQDGTFGEEDSDDSDNEYNYSEPNSLLGLDSEELARLNLSELKPQMPRLFDSAQRREDEEIAHVTRRDKLKRPNAAFVALHHKNYETRNVGKQQTEYFKPYDGNAKGKKGKRDQKDRRQTLISLPYLNPEFYAFGLVEAVLGGSHFVVYCYADGAFYLSRLTRVLKRSAATWISQGDVVIIKMRGNRMIKADLLMKLSAEEYFFLPRIGCMKNHDPAKALPGEIMLDIFKLIPYVDLVKCAQVNEAWKTLLPQIVIENEVKPSPEDVRDALGFDRSAPTQ